MEVEEKESKKKSPPIGKMVLFTVIALFWLIRFYGFWLATQELNADVGKTVEVTGKVYMQKQTKRGYEYYLQAEEIKQNQGNIQKSNLKFQFYSPQWIQLHSYIKVEGVLAVFDVPKNTGDWNQKQYFMAKNIYYTIKKANSIVLVEGKPSWSDNAKDWVKKQSSYFFPAMEQGLLLSLFAGDKQGLDKDIADNFRKSGVSHVLAISGLHIGLIIFFLSFILKKLPLPYWVQFGVAIAFLGIYLVFTGIQVSTMRAVIMFFFLEGAYFLNRAKDPKTAFWLTLILILFYNPFSIYDVGFLLSFLTVAGLLYLHPILFKDAPKWLQAIGITLISQIVLLPIYSLYFHKISLIAILANLWIIPAIAWFLGLAILALFWSKLSIVLAQVFAGGAYFLAQSSYGLTNFFSKIEWSELPIRAMRWWEILLYYGVIIGVVRTKKKRYLFGLLWAIFLLIPFAWNPELTMLDVGQAESMVLNYRNHTIVIDAGLEGNRSTVNYLAYQGRNRIDLVLLSHLDKDHAGGLAYLLEHCNIGGIGLADSYRNLDQEWAELYGLEKTYQSYQELLQLANRYQVPVYYWQAGDTITMDELTMHFLYPQKEELPSTSNDFSLVIEMEYYGVATLFTGDIGKEVEELLLERDLVRQTEVLKVAHHGSRHSSTPEFLQKNNPALAIVSCGRYNRYGHPSQDLISYFQDKKIPIRVTAWDGMIVLHYTKKGEVILDE